jgi:hypothetical protein
MQLRTISRVGLVALACCMPATLPTRVAGMDVPNSPLDAGFRLMYNLDFVRAQQQFSAY